MRDVLRTATTLRTHAASRRWHYGGAVAVFLVGAILASTLFAKLQHGQRHQIRQDLEWVAQDRFSVLKRLLELDFLVLRSLGSFFDSSAEVERAEFARFSATLIKGNASIRTLQWAPRVEASQRRQFDINAARLGCPNCRITQLDRHGNLIDSLPRSEYFPKLFVEPIADNITPLGIDLGAEPECREVMNRVRDTGLIGMTPCVDSVDGTDTVSRFRVFLPVYRQNVPNDTIAERRANLLGFVSAVLSVQGIMSEGLSNLAPANIDITVVDTTIPGQHQLLCRYRSSSTQPGVVDGQSSTSSWASTLRVDETLNAGGRRWIVTCRPLPGFIADRTTWYPWEVAVTVLLLAGLLAVYLVRMAARHELAERHANELAAINRELQAEIAERQRAETTLWASETKYKTLYDLSSDAILLFDPDTGYVNGNRASLALFGCKDESEFREKSAAEQWSPIWQADGTPSAVRSREMVAIAMRDGTHHFEWTYKRLDGTEFLATVSLARMDILGKPYLQATVRDITDQRRTETLLQASERHYRLLTENISDVIWSIDAAGQYTYVSPTVFQQRGYTPEEIMAESTDQSLTPESAIAVREYLQMAIAAAKAGSLVEFDSIEVEIRRKDGSTFWGESTFNAIYDDAGELTAIQGSTRDISERKRVEKALHESERRFADMVEFLPDATFAVDRERKVIMWNRAIEKMTGVPASEILGKGDRAYSNALFGDARPILVDRVLDESADVDPDIQSIRREGSQLIGESFSQRLHEGHGAYCSGVASPLYDSDGSVAGAIESIRDITDLREAQQELRESEQRFMDVLRKSADAMFLIDDRKIVTCNDAAARMLGYPSSDSFLAVSPGVLSPTLQPDGRPSIEKADEMMAIASDRGSHRFEWVHQKMDGAPLPVEVSLTSLVAEGRNRLLCVWRDISEQKRAQKALEESERRLATIIDFLPDATFAVDRNGCVIAWNHAIEEITGVPASEMLGKGDYAYAVPLYGVAKPIVIDMVLGEHQGQWHEYDSVERKGSLIVAERFVPGLRGGKGAYIWGVAAPLFDSEGRMVGAIESFRDITEQKRAADALRTSETKYRAVYDGAIDGIMLRTPDRRIVAANRASVAMFGYADEAELIAAPLAELYPERQPDGSSSSEAAARMVAIALREGSHRFEWNYRRQDGSSFYATVALTPIDIDETRYLLTTIRDITEQKQAEEAVRASETKYRTLYDVSSDAILLRTLDRRVISGNRAAIALFACKDEAELCAMTPADLYPEFQPDGRLSSEKAPEMVDAALRGGSHSFDWKYRRRDGTEFFATVLWTKMVLEGESILLTTIRDITKQKQAEEALRASERRYRLLADNASDVIWVVDFSEHFTYMTPSIEQLLGYTPADACQLTLEAVLTPPSLEIARTQLQTLIAEAQIGERPRGGTLELEQIRKDGSAVMTEVSYSGMYDESGQMVAVQGVGRDITSRKLVEEERKLSSERMESLLTLSHMGDKPMDEIIAMVVEDAIRMTQSTIGYLAMVNEDESVLSMQYWSKSAHADCRVSTRPIVYPLENTGLWGEAVRQRQPVVTNDYAAPSPMKRGMPEGHVPIVRHMNVPVFDGQHIVAVAGVGNKPSDYDERDLRQLQLLMEGWWHIAKQRQYETNLAKARDDAQAANRAKSKFLAAMSHEIRTPMTSILGYADLLMDPNLSPSNRNNYATTIRRSGEHLLSLINDILDLSKIEAGKMTLDLGRCSILSVLADVASLLRPRAERHGISLSIEYSHAIPATIHTDGARLRQAIINLVGNAVKFTETGGVRIVVSFLPDGCDGQPAVQFAVVDTGIGIREEVIPRLFQPFSQADASTAQKYGGTGLGLTISHHIAQLLGGTLTVTSDFGQGSTFTLTIPTGSLDGVAMLENPAEAMEQDSARSAWTADVHNLNGVRILLAEDGYDNRELIRTVLQHVGAKIVTAENGRVAVEKAQTDVFDLILMDMNMPEMDGYEATGKLRELGYRGSIVALTANAMVGDDDRCRLAGCDEYLTKPINRAVLIRTIAALVDTEAAAARAGVAPTEGSENAPESATAADAPRSASAEPLDVPDAIVSEFINDPEMTPIIEGFVGRLAGQLEAMRQALAASGFEELQRLAHKMKGAGGSYGYPALTETGRVLEEAAKAKDGDAASPALDQLAAVVHAIERPFVSSPSGGEVP